MKTAAAIVLATVLAAATPAAADEPAEGPAADTHPVLSTDAGWVRWMLLAAGGVTAAALLAGPIVLARHPEVIADATSHEEDPSADRHRR